MGSHAEKQTSQRLWACCLVGSLCLSSLSTCLPANTHGVPLPEP